MIGEFSGPIFNSTIDFPDYEFVHIVCYKNTAYEVKSKIKNFKRKDSDIIHDEIIPLIPRIEKSTDSVAPNVLLLAIDSMSFVNFKRHFHKTEEFLRKNNFSELLGYNKLGQNTFPNMVPFLTGYHAKELQAGMDLMKVNFEEWPIIWKNYSKEGFVTVFVEEMASYGLFRYHGRGFSKKPTDYSTRPFHMEIHNQRNNKFCYKDKTETQVNLHFIEGKVEIQN